MGTKKIVIDIDEQTARLLDDAIQIKIYQISSAAEGVGFEPNSNKTPVGRFKICQKIGEGCEAGSVFKARQPTGEVCTESPRSPKWQSNEDLILSRILWLDGIEPQNSNTRERLIYLHGTNQEHLLGKAVSQGCIRFSNKDIVDLFELVDEGCEVIIVART